MTSFAYAAMLLLGIGGISGDELLVVFLPFLVALGFLGWVLLTMVRSFQRAAESLASISRSLEKLAARAD